MPEQIASLAALKRAVQVGTRIEVLTHWQGALSGTVRTVRKVLGHGYAADQPGRTGLAWAYWPKAAELTFNADGSWTQRYGDSGKTATFRLVPPGEPPAAATERDQ